MKTLHVQNLSNGYGGAAVISDISFVIQAGESVALLGRNGAGKTTLLHSLFNIGPRCQGQILLDGERIDGLPTHRIARAGLALVPQGRGGFPELSVRESLGLATLAVRAVRTARATGTTPTAPAAGKHGGHPRTLADIYQRFPRLHERRRTLCANLSGGERQLLALARALLTQADLIVLDEPSEGLAPLAIRDMLLPELHKLRAQGYTVLLAEQNISLALAAAARVILLADRRVVFDGSATDFAARPELQHTHLGL